MESKIESNAEYTLLSRGEVHPSACCGGDAAYPGNRRHAIPSQGPPPDTVLIKTAGNALQAVTASALQSTHVMAASVPHNMSPGDTLFVVVPDGSDRTIQAVIPENTFPGHLLLIEVPPMDKQGSSMIATGIPFASPTSTEEGTPVVMGRNVEPTDLHLSQVVDVEMSPTSPTEQQLVADSNQEKRLT